MCDRAPTPSGISVQMTVNPLEDGDLGDVHRDRGAKFVEEVPLLRRSNGQSLE
jgi:hypothetical protein